VKKKIPIIIISVIFSIIVWGTISLSSEYYSNIEVPLRIINFPQGYTTSSELPKKVTVKLKGEGWKLFTLNIGKEVTYDVSVKGDSGFKEIKIADYLSDNRWIVSELAVIDIIPGKISCLIERKIKKNIAITADIKLDFKAGFGLSKQITLEPDSVMVEGPQSLLKNLSEVKTKEVKLSSLDKRTIKNIGFAELPGTDFGTNFVTITLEVQRIVDKQFDDITVEVLDVPPGRNVVLLPNKISCSVRGGIEILGKLEKKQFNAFIHYREIVLDTLGSVVPQMDLPANTNLVYIKPDRLRYIIKKY